MPEKEAQENGFHFDFATAYLGFVFGMCFGAWIVMAGQKRDKEKVRRHLERALDEVDG
jgi:hypothetical protein